MVRKEYCCRMVRKMDERDWDRVAVIYKQGIESGIATFNTGCPSYEEWDRSHLKECRLVCEENGTVLGWIALSPTSPKEAYRGVVEVSIYIDENCRGKGIGRSLMDALKIEAVKCGFWSLFSVVLSVNEPSIGFHKSCGFREIGYKERVARDKFGKWQNTTLMELRL